MKRNVYFFTLLILIAMIGCDDVIKEYTTTISGKVTNDGTLVSGAYVILLEAGVSASTGISLSNGMITDSNGDYMMVEVSAGDYYVAAIDDDNDNVVFDSDTDKIGYYGDADPITELTIPRTLQVKKGDDIEDINITKLYSLP